MAGCGLLRMDVPAGRHELEAFCHATGFTHGSRSFERPLRKRS